jgi:hypothetical protein
LTERFICIHGHFYQPPQESPWLEAIGIQDSAFPYHDWNERITAECYAANAMSRIWDMEGRIAQIEPYLCIEPHLLLLFRFMAYISWMLIGYDMLSCAGNRSFVKRWRGFGQVRVPYQKQ